MRATVVTLLALAALSPTVADAQNTAVAGVAPRAALQGADPADRLAAEAYRLFDDRSTWRRAARMLEQSAEMRAAADPARVSTMLDAARVYAHVGALSDARRVFEEAAAAASARGAVLEAAHALLDAAIAAAQTGDRAGADALIAKGLLLSASPHIGQSAREGILKRIPNSGDARG